MMKKHKQTNQNDESWNDMKETDPSLEESGKDTPSIQMEQPAVQESQAAMTAEQEVEELRQKWQRLAADYQNYQKRMQRQLEQTSQMAQENVVRSLIPVLDNFLHTLEKGTNSEDVHSVLQGIQIVYDHLMNTLSSLGMKRIDVQPGVPFNPQFHEAMMQEETSEFPSGTVVRELAGGYCMNDRALRPAKVSVAKTPAETECPPSQEPSSDRETQE